MHVRDVMYLSNLVINVDKDWGSHRITNLGAPNSDDDAVPRGLVDPYAIDRGLKWVDLGVCASGAIRAMAYLGNGIAILGDGVSHVWRSTNYGATWVDLGVNASGIIYAMANLGNGIVVLGDYANHVWRSTDYGSTWADLGIKASSGIGAMTYLGNGIAILGDYANHVWRSTDYGATWADLGINTNNHIHTIAYLGNGIVVLGNDNGHVWRSTSAFQLSNFNPNQFDKLFEFGCLGAISAGGTSYLAPGNGASQTNEIKVRAPRPGILKNLYVWQRVASGLAGRTDIYTVRVNGVNTTITCTLDNATTGSDITHTVLVAAGDQISVMLVSNDTTDTSADIVATLELI